MQEQVVFIKTPSGTQKLSQDDSVTFVSTKNKEKLLKVLDNEGTEVVYLNCKGFTTEGDSPVKVTYLCEPSETVLHEGVGVVFQTFKPLPKTHSDCI